jgi:hypothetical protein
MSEKDPLVGKKIRVCHKRGKIVEKNPQSYTVDIELGDVINRISVSEQFAEENHLG